MPIVDNIIQNLFSKNVVQNKDATVIMLSSFGLFKQLPIPILSVLSKKQLPIPLKKNDES